MLLSLTNSITCFTEFYSLLGFPDYPAERAASDAEANAGDDEDGYSEALFEVDQKCWFPLWFRASDAETRVIDGVSPDVPGTDSILHLL